MRVLHVYRTYFPDTQGGLEEAIRQICASTKVHGVENRVFMLSRNPQPAIINRPEVDFTNANLRGLDLRKADLEKVILRDAYLRDADLRGCDLRHMELEGASFHGAKVAGAYFPAALSPEEVQLSLVHGTRVRTGKEGASR